MYNQLFSILIQFARNTLVFNESYIQYSNGYNDCGGNAFDVRLAYHQPEQNHAVVFVHQQMCIVSVGELGLAYRCIVCSSMHASPMTMWCTEARW